MRGLDPAVSTSSTPVVTATRTLAVRTGLREAGRLIPSRSLPPAAPALGDGLPPEPVAAPIAGAAWRARSLRDGWSVPPLEVGAAIPSRVSAHGPATSVWRQLGSGPAARGLRNGRPRNANPGFTESRPAPRPGTHASPPQSPRPPGGAGYRRRHRLHEGRDRPAREPRAAASEDGPMRPQRSCRPRAIAASTQRPAARAAGRGRGLPDQAKTELRAAPPPQRPGVRGAAADFRGPRISGAKRGSVFA